MEDRESSAAGARIRAANEAKNPGSAAATAAGCTCPVIDNARGLGYMRQPGIFVITEHCPLHGVGAKATGAA